VAVRLDPGFQQPGTTRTIAAAPDGGVVRRSVLRSGVRVLSEAVPGVRSVAFGVWVGVGSRDESPASAGASHYLEHLLFKGTRRRTALHISAALEAVGGELNAFTTKEYTCYYARVLDTDLPLAVDVVMDMVTSSLLRPTDVEAERSVILEEMAMHDDDPTDAVHDAFAAAAWGAVSPLGRPVLGSAEQITSIPRRALARHYRDRYRPEQLVVTAAGHLDHGRLTRLVRAALARARVDGEATPCPARRPARAVRFTPTVRVTSRPTEQANLVLGTRGIPRSDPRRFALGVLCDALGGGMSSRLFQEIREKRGLAYSVYSFAAQYTDTGLFGVYAGCQPGRAEDVLALVRGELDRAARAGITADELARGKGQLTGSLVLGLEDTGSRMSRLGKGELVYGELLTVDEILDAVRAVTGDDVAQIAAEVLGGPLALAVIGPFDHRDFLAAVR
jgi:predicted Zn-dependent peptidase